EIGQEVQRRRDLAKTGEVVLDEEHAVKAELFGLADVMDVVAVNAAVARLLAGIGARAAEQSKPHSNSPFTAFGRPRRAGGAQRNPPPRHQKSGGFRCAPPAPPKILSRSVFI